MNDDRNIPPGAVVIGASVGAVEALSAILPALPAGFPLPVLVVVHVPAERRSALPELFAARCALQVKEAEDKEPLLPGVIYFAAPDYHLQVEPGFSLSLSSEEPVLFSRPAIDILFQTAADAFGDSLTGVILTGANSDGARGLRAVCDAGGKALVQSPYSAEGKQMPASALIACPEAHAVPLDRLAGELLALTAPH